MKFTTLALTLASASALTTEERQDHAKARAAMVEEINASQDSWKASPGRWNGQPIGASAGLLGVKEGSHASLTARVDDEADELFVRAPKISAEEAAALPESFDSEENWPQCAKVIGDIRDQSNCGCCWAFGAASAASDRACIATNATIALPFSAQDTCFNAQSNGCGGGMLETPWEFFKNEGVVTGTQNLEDSASSPSDPFFGANLCSAFSLPHCHHHGDQGSDPYPAEGEDGCPSEDTPAGPTACDSGAAAPHNDFAADKYSFDGQVYMFPSDADTIAQAIMTDGPVEAAFTVYEDFENYASGVYSHTTGSTLGGHAIRIVGWGVEDGQQYWKVANSWNPYWGEKGYFRIAKGTDECGIESQVTASSSGSNWALKSEL